MSVPGATSVCVWGFSGSCDRGCCKHMAFKGLGWKGAQTWSVRGVVAGWGASPGVQTVGCRGCRPGEVQVGNPGEIESGERILWTEVRMC